MFHGKHLRALATIQRPAYTTRAPCRGEPLKARPRMAKCRGVKPGRQCSCSPGSLRMQAGVTRTLHSGGLAVWMPAAAAPQSNHEKVTRWDRHPRRAGALSLYGGQIPDLVRRGFPGCRPGSDRIPRALAHATRCAAGMLPPQPGPVVIVKTARF